MARKFLNSIDSPIVETKEGKLRGFLIDGVYTFYGIKYAEADRFQQPRPPEPWDGIKNATNYGYICPVDGNPEPSGEIFTPHRFWPSDEHCQNLNIWTLGIADGRKRPVMVWLHGGGFANGSAIEQVSYEGDNLSKFGDVVVVSINHRLNILGYFDMSSFGEKYSNSVNAGMADIVAALQWIHDNIEAFGGDPGNVTVFGQSGGGGKIQALLQIPAAAGLFHKAIIMSGILPQREEKTIDYRAVALGILKELDIAEENVEELETVPYFFLNRAYQKVTSEMGIRIDWNPKPNEWYLGDPMKVGFSDYARKVPTIAGSTIAEFGMRDVEKTNRETNEELLADIKAKYGDSSDRIVELFGKTYPDKPLTLLKTIDSSFRSATVNFIERMAEESSAPCYLYSFGLEFPVLGGTHAWHCSDIPFVFHNTARVPNCNIDGVTERLEQQMAGAWVSFAYSGNPNHPGLPKWDTVENNRATMVFDVESECRHDHDTALLSEIAGAAQNVTDSLKTSSSSKSKKEWLY